MTIITIKIETIETAPIDGTRILLYVPWEGYRGKHQSNWTIAFWNGQWWETGGPTIEKDDPTHWAPLPPEMTDGIKVGTKEV
jgi:hypothetical protein